MVLGIQNEIDIANSLNNKTINELNDNLQQFIRFIFPNINNNDIIHSRKIKGFHKADILVEINGTAKGISIKIGSHNSVHTEKLDSFILFLQNIRVNSNIINNLKLYHYGDGTLNGSGSKRLDIDEVKIKYSNEIKAFNKYISYDNLLSKVIDRFLFSGTINNKYNADFIYYGNNMYGFWASKNEVIKYFLRNKSQYMKSIHFSNLTYQNRCRNINKISSSESRRSYMQVKWFSIVSDLQKIRSDNSYNYRK